MKPSTKRLLAVLFAAMIAGGLSAPAMSTPLHPKAKCNAGNGNGSETTPASDCDPGNSGGNNNGGD
jgi:hypothetical protein